MNKGDFLTQPCSGLSALPLADTEERITFYDEMINDRMGEGLSEEEAVCAVGTVDEIAKNDAAELTIKTTAGNVRASLCSDKLFFHKAKPGRSVCQRAPRASNAKL